MEVRNEKIRKELIRFTETTQWNRSASEREQVVHIYEILKDRFIDVSQNDLARFFGIDRSTIRYHLKQGIDMINPCERPIGRPKILSEEEIEAMKNIITECYQLKYPATYRNVADFIKDTFNKTIKMDTIRHIIASIEDLHVATGIPMENEHVFCDPQKIDEYFDWLEDALGFGIPPEFIFNIDESGYQEWVDAKNLQCIVPSSYNKNRIKMPRDKTTKRVTMLGGICAYGSTLKPMIVLTRNSIEKELLDNEYTEDKLIYGRSKTGFMNQKLFIEWTTRSFVPEMKMKHSLYSYDGPILLIMDGFSVHDCDQFREILEEKNICSPIFAQHNSEQNSRNTKRKINRLIVFAMNSPLKKL